MSKLLGTRWKHKGSHCYAVVVFESVGEEKLEDFCHAYPTKRIDTIVVKYYGESQGVVSMYKEDFLWDYEKYEATDEEIAQELGVLVFSKDN
jgi:hypothetical protein